MSTLAIALSGPLAAYPNSTHERYRHTALIPTKSAVCGLIGACLGRDYQDDQQDLYALKVHVRADQSGQVMTDYQTVEGATRANGSVNPAMVIVQRQLLQDSAYLVVIEGEQKLLKEIERALQNPVFMPYLGLRSCIPSRPIYVEEVSEESPTELMQRLTPLGGSGPTRLAYFEEESGVLTLHDQPLAHRRFTRRYLNPRPITVRNHHAPDT